MCLKERAVESFGHKRKKEKAVESVAYKRQREREKIIFESKGQEIVLINREWYKKESEGAKVDERVVCVKERAKVYNNDTKQSSKFCLLF